MRHDDNNTLAAGLAELVNRGTLVFASGLPGFETVHAWRLVERSDAWPFMLLCSADPPEVGLVVVEPQVVAPEYQVQFTPEELSRVNLTAGDSAVTLVVATLDPGRPTVNLRAPLVLNPQDRLGAQVILDDSRWSFEHPMFPPPAAD